MDTAAAYILLAALIVAVPLWAMVMDALSRQAVQDAYDDLREDEDNGTTL